MTFDSSRAFLHIPKTGGQSLAKVVPVSTTKAMRMHIPSSCIREPVKLFSVIRDPVDRIYSLFRYSTALDLELFLQDIADPIEWRPDSYSSSRAWIKSKKRIEDNDYSNENNDTFLHCVDQLNVDWFEQRKPTGLLTSMLDLGVPGHVVANQWDYIENSNGHDIELISFHEIKKSDGVPCRNTGTYTREQKDKDLTPSIVNSIRKLCHKDYEHLSAYF